MIVKLACGATSVAVDLRGLRVKALAPTAPRSLPALAESVAAALDRPLDTPALAELARGRRGATVIVPDATRQASLPEVLPVVLHRLLGAGIENRRLTVLIACGTHPPAPIERLSDLLGPLPPGVEVIQHDARQEEELLAVGEVAPGRRIRLHRRAVECDLLVTLGGVRHHYFAGFGGGPKLVFPGVAGYQEIQANHALVVRRTTAGPARDDRCEPGALAGNPVAEEIARAADLRPPDLAVALAPGSDGRPAAVLAGSWRRAHAEAVDLVRNWYEVPRDDGFQLVVASAGGAPGDTTLIQAHKALDAACRFARQGAEVLFVADLGGGPGSREMAPFLADPEPERILARLAESWVQYGHTTLRLVEKTAAHRVHLLSRLDAVLSRRLGFLPVEDPDDVIERWRSRAAPSTVAVMAGQAVYPRR